MRTFLLGVFVLSVMCLSPPAASGFDGKRTGLVLGGGIGVSVMSYTQTVTRTRPPAGTKHFEADGEFGYVADFTIGVGLDEQLMILWPVNFRYVQPVKNVSVGMVLRLYVPDDAPSVFFDLVGWWTSFFGNTPYHAGSGFGGGIGWEFTRHWSVEAAVRYSYAQLDERNASWLLDYSPSVETESFSVLVTVVGLAY